MKRLIFSLMSVLSACVAFGQIKPPQQTDTLYIHSVKYNYADIRQENWPCEVIYKSTTSFRIGEDEFFVKSADKFLSEITFYVSGRDDMGRHKLLYNEASNGNIIITFSGYEFVCRTGPKVNVPVPQFDPDEFSLPESDDWGDFDDEVDDSEAVPFQLVEVKPQFQGGDSNKFSKWVNQQLVYPEDAKDAGVQGRVTLQFTVGKNGKIRDVKVLRKVHPSLDKEAVRVVSMSPRWTPGQQRGLPVAVTYTFPVIFQTR